MHKHTQWIPTSGGNETWGEMKTKSAAARLKRINLAGIATNSAATKTAKVYPLLPDADGQVAALVEGILEKSEQLEAIRGALEIEKAGLTFIVKLLLSMYIITYKKISLIFYASKTKSGEATFIRSDASVCCVNVKN
jgi:hypothetical protein